MPALRHCQASCLRSDVRRRLERQFCTRIDIGPRQSDGVLQQCDALGNGCEGTVEVMLLGERSAVTACRKAIVELK